MHEITPEREAELLAEIAALRTRLEEPEQTIWAIRHGLVDAFVVLEPNGERVHTLGTAELVRQLQLITDSLPVLIAYIDRDGCYRFNNRRYETWLGRPLHEILGQPMSAVIGAEAYGAIRPHVEAALAGREVAFEIWLPNPGGADRCIHATYLPHEHDGEVLGFVSFIEEVTERKRAEEALRLLADAGRLLSESLGSEEILEIAARLAVPGLADWCTIDLTVGGAGGGQHFERTLQTGQTRQTRKPRKSVSVHANPAHQELLDQLPRHPHQGDRAALLAQVLATGEPVLLPDLAPPALDFFEQDATAAGGNGSARALELLAPRSVLAVPLVAHGRRLGVWSFFYADSGRRHRREDVWLAQELARRAGVALDNSRLYRDLEAANRAKDHFLATLSHELRTPLTPILAVSSSLGIDERLPESVRTGLEMIRRNVELEARLIDDLLDLTRVASGKLELRNEPTDVHQVIRQAFEICGGPALAGWRLIEDLAAEEHVVWADPSRLTQVFWNLFNNALKFTPDGGTLTLRSRTEEGAAQPDRTGAPCLVVEVADSGIGIEAEALPHIFDAFVQGRAGLTRRTGGLGLGLAISRAIVEAHGGSLTATSSGADRGAVFTVRLPLDGLATAADRGAPQEEAAVAAPGRPLRILLVEDHADTSETMARLLAAMGHQVTAAATAAAALAAAETADFELVISDLGLPDGDGYDLMRALRRRRPISGIALSGYGRDEDIARGRAAGFDLHLTKPVSLPALRTAIAQVAGGD
jgi:PAS domain S-box-containing protein